MTLTCAPWHYTTYISNRLHPALTAISHYIGIEINKNDAYSKQKKNMKDGIPVSIGQEYTFLKLSGIYRIYDGVEAETRKCHASFKNTLSYERLAEHQT